MRHEDLQRASLIQAVSEGKHRHGDERTWEELPAVCVARNHQIDSIRGCMLSFFNDLLEVLPSPVVAQVDVRELHRDDVVVQARECDLGLHNREPVGPHAPDERRAGRRKQRRRSHATVRYVPRPVFTTPQGLSRAGCPSIFSIEIGNDRIRVPVA